MSRFIHTKLTGLKSFFKAFLPNKLSKYHYRAFFAFAIVFLFLFSTQIVHASIWDGFAELIASLLLALAKIAMALTIFFLRYFITLASYNDFINVSVVKLGWVMVRDVANMFFVVSLLVIAFATILGVEKYEWKKGLVKLVIMAVLINFSNLIAQIIIDAAHVFTITFLNAVSASAGGNLINMFSMDKMMSIIQGRSIGENIETASFSLFGASVIALMFAVGTTIAIGSYVIVMGLRIVVLWALIILSPLAYLFSALPGGQKYSSKWWQEFSRHVIVAPVMVFFLWLAFATLGTGQIMNEIQSSATIPLQQSSDAISVSITDVSTWENMANYILALLFLIIGLRMTQETGATASGMVGAAENYVKKVATIASGYAAGRWLTDRGSDKGKSLVGKAAYHMPLGGKFWKTTGQDVKGKALAKYGKYKEKRETKYANFEKNHPKAKYAKRALGILTGGLLGESASRRAKRAKDWEETAERQKAIYEESYSTSSTTSGGQAKIKVTARKKLQENMIAQKKEKKIEAEIQEILKEGSDRQGFEYDNARKFVTVEAKERASRRELRREKEITDARAEAEQLRSEGKHLEAAAVVESVYKKHQKEEQEVFASMDYNQSINAARDVAARLARGEGNAEQQANLRKDAFKLLNVAATDREKLEEMLDVMVSEVHRDPITGQPQSQEITADNVGQRFVEAITGQQVNTQQQFHDAHRLLEGSNTFRNAEDSQAAFASFASSLKVQAKEGGLRSVGAVIEDVAGANAGDNLTGDHVDGKVISYRFASNRFGAPAPGTGAVLSDAERQVETDVVRKQKTEEYFEARTDLRSSTDLHGYMNVQDGTITGLGGKQRNNLETALGGFGDVRAVNTGFNSNISKGNRLSKYNAQAQQDVLYVLYKLKTETYRDNQPVFEAILDNQFPDWKPLLATYTPPANPSAVLTR